MMVRIAQVISVLIFAAAGLLFAQEITVLVRDEPRAEPVTGPSATERFRQGRSGQSDESERQPPLIEQAQAFALYLNPPPPPVASAPAPRPAAAGMPTLVRSSRTVADASPVQPPASSPKFELYGISYYRAKPEQSMALVLEPDGRCHWVRPGDQLGHLTIERIDSTSLVCREGTQTHVVALAPMEAVAKYARNLKDTSTAATPAQAQRQPPGPEVPPPAPGIRQMPPARVAALLGRPS
jgi:hypothetical protein